ncbi:MAG: flagellar FliJ family protein [Terriglobales bacterium]|jgi:flagellar export protein FliJ
MAFHFALEPILRLRQSLERQRAIALQRASMDVVRAEEALGRLDRVLDESAEEDSRLLTGGRMAAELHFSILLREQLRQLRVRVEEEIGRLEAVRQEAARVYRRAMQEREALEALRASQRRVYQREQMRREQQETDAAFLLRRWPHREG